MIIFYSFVMIFGGYLLGSYIRKRTWDRVVVLAVVLSLFAVFTQISANYVMTHPNYHYSGYYRY